MKATVFIMLYKVVLTIKSVDERLFIMLYKVVLPFKSVNESLVCNHSIESY